MKDNNTNLMVLDEGQVYNIAQVFAEKAGTTVSSIELIGDRYYVTTDYGNSSGIDFSIPQNCTINASTSLYFHGGGGISDIVKQSEEKITGDLIAFYPRGVDTSDEIDAIKLIQSVDAIQTNLGINNNNYKVVAFSSGGKAGVDFSKEILAKDSNTVLDLILLDSVGDGQFLDSYSNEELKKLAKESVTVYIYEKDNDKIDNFEKMLVNNGIDVTVVHSGIAVEWNDWLNKHNEVNKTALLAGVMNDGIGWISNLYFLGDCRRLLLSNGTISSNYKFIRLNVGILNSVVNRIGLKSISGIVNNLTSKSSTVSTVMQTVNNYFSKSLQFYSYVDVICSNLLGIAESYKDLDKELSSQIVAESTNVSFYDIQSLDLQQYKQFYNQIGNSLFGATGNIKLISAELDQSCSDKNIILSILSQDIIDTKNLKNELDIFCNSSLNVLFGESWDKIREKITEFSDLCEQKNKYTQNIIGNIKNAYGSLLGYLGHYELDVADTSELEEYEALYNELCSNVIFLENELQRLIDENGSDIYNGLDEDGNPKIVGRVNNDLVISDYRKELEDCEYIVQKIKKTLDALYGLPNEDAKAASIVVNKGF